MIAAHEPLRTVRAAELDVEPPDAQWLIRSLWAKGAAGVLGGAPKLGKSWIGIDMAVSVASGTPCLGRFEIDDPGPVLVYLAEDPLPSVRTRIEALCHHRGLELPAIELFAIDTPALHLDVVEDRMRLRATIERIRPKLLVLDPLVRMHSLDENSAGEVSRLLGALTKLQRTFGCAIVLVHHASKRSTARPGEALRGSTDLHAWGASNAYLTRRHDRTLLTLEHRAARAPEPLVLDLVSKPDGTATHFEIVGGAKALDQPPPLDEQIVDLLDEARAPMRRHELRAKLRVNNLRLGQALHELERRGDLNRTADGWRIAD